MRFQLGNHLGSAALELDNQAQVISYEEYHPYGSTAYHAARSKIETPKRYRYTGKERDEETGFSYHGARYYAGWLGRWVSCDPIGLRGGINVFRYVADRPVGLTDPNGTQECTSMLCDPKQKTESSANQSSPTAIVDSKVQLVHQIENFGGPTLDVTKFSEPELYRQFQVWQSKRFNTPTENKPDAYTSGIKGTSVARQERDFQLRMVNIYRFRTEPGAWMATGPMVNNENPEDVSSYLDLAQRVNTVTTMAAPLTLKSPVPQIVVTKPGGIVGTRGRDPMPPAAAAAGLLPRSIQLGIQAQYNPDNVLRTLRSQGTDEARATAKLISRGEVQLDLLPTAPANAHKEARGGNPLGTNKAQVYVDRLKLRNTTNEELARLVGHEAFHAGVQSLSPSNYTLTHELEAYTWQARLTGEVNTANELPWMEQKYGELLQNPVYKNTPRF